MKVENKGCNMARLGIIGGGIFGLSAAYWGLRKGYDVEIFERATIGSGASGGLVGALAPYMPDAWHEKKDYQLRALLAAEGFWAEIDRESSGTSGYGRIGRIQKLMNERGRALAISREADVAAHWPEGYIWQVDPDIPHPFESAPLGFVYDSLSARLNPRGAVMALANAVVARGGKIHENSPVYEIYPLAKSFDGLIVAGGYHGWALTQSVTGVSFGQGTKGQALLCKPQNDWRYPLVMAENFYVLPHEDGTVAVGSTSEDKWEREAVDEKLETLWARAISAIPELQNTERLTTWAGVRARGYRPDPILGKLPETENIFILNGGYKTGFGFAHQLGQDLVRMIDGENVNLPETFTIDGHRTYFKTD